jgi:hypothetical protein
VLQLLEDDSGARAVIGPNRLNRNPRIVPLDQFSYRASILRLLIYTELSIVLCMVDTVYRLVPQKDRHIGVEMAKPNGYRRIIPDFADEAEANAWIIQTKRLIRCTQPYMPGPKPKDGAVLQIGDKSPR